MPDARDFDDWRSARDSRNVRNLNDPCPPGGIVETTYCTLHAMTGAWPADFLAIVKVAYRGQIPRRFHARSAKIKRDREIAELQRKSDEEADRGVLRVWVAGELVETIRRDPST